MLGEDLAAWPQDAWLAVDDYHFAMESEASETFVEELLARCPVRLLITSRTRPTWATARRMLYGEILEVGRSALVLTHEEAREVLHERPADEVAGVLALTEGWPAVIGLASLSSDLVLSEAEVPDALYGYCAEELFQRFAPDLQRALCTLALAPSISVELVRALYGEEAVRIVRVGRGRRLPDQRCERRLRHAPAAACRAAAQARRGRRRPGGSSDARTGRTPHPSCAAGMKRSESRSEPLIRP